MQKNTSIVFSQILSWITIIIMIIIVVAGEQQLSFHVGHKIIYYSKVASGSLNMDF